MRSISKNEVTSSIPVTANQCYAANASMDVNPAYGCQEDQEMPLDHAHKEIITSEHHYAEIADMEQTYADTDVVYAYNLQLCAYNYKNASMQSEVENEHYIGKIILQLLVIVTRECYYTML